MKDLRILRELVAIIILIVMGGWCWLVTYFKKIEEKELAEQEKKKERRKKMERFEIWNEEEEFDEDGASDCRDDDARGDYFAYRWANLLKRKENERKENERKENERKGE